MSTDLPVATSGPRADAAGAWASLPPGALAGAAQAVEYVHRDALAEWDAIVRAREQAFAAAGRGTPPISTVVVDRFLDDGHRVEVEVSGGVLGEGVTYLPSLLGRGGDLAAQCEQVFTALDQALPEGSHVVQTVDFTTRATLRDYKATGRIRKEHLHPPYPGAAGILVTALRGGALVQLDAVASSLPVEEVNPGWERYGKLTYRPAVRSGDVLWMAGQAALDPATEQAVHTGDLAEQTRYTYENIVRVLEAAGGGRGHLVKLVEYVTPAGALHYSETHAARRAVLGDDHPPVTVAVCDTLLRPEFEIEVIPLAVLA